MRSSPGKRGSESVLASRGRGPRGSGPKQREPVLRRTAEDGGRQPASGPDPCWDLPSGPDAGRRRETVALGAGRRGPREEATAGHAARAERAFRPRRPVREESSRRLSWRPRKGPASPALLPLPRVLSLPPALPTGPTLASATGSAPRLLVCAHGHAAWLGGGDRRVTCL